MEKPVEVKRTTIPAGKSESVDECEKMDAVESVDQDLTTAAIEGLLAYSLYDTDQTEQDATGAGCHLKKTSPMDKKPGDKTAVKESSPMEESTAAKKATKESSPMEEMTPADNKATKESSPMEEMTPADKATKESSPMEEMTPADKATKESSPMEESSATKEGSPAKRATKKRSPMEEISAKEGSPAKKATKKRSPMEESSAKEGTPADKKATKESSPMEESTPADKKATKEGSPMEESSAKEGTPGDKNTAKESSPTEENVPGDETRSAGESPVEELAQGLQETTIEVTDANKEMAPSARPIDPLPKEWAPPKTRWERFCQDVIAPVEEQVLTIIGEMRPTVDNMCQESNEDENSTLHEWTFSFTSEVRDYLVNMMLNTVFGFARHGDGMLDVVGTEDFRTLINVIMGLEAECFMGENITSKEMYFNQLSNYMLLLTPLAELPVGSEVIIPDDDIPLDPVDALFHYYGSEEERTDEVPCAKHTLHTLLGRTGCIEEKREQLLSRMKIFKDQDVRLGLFEKRFDKLAEGIKSITHQMLHDPMQGESMVVHLFGYILYCVVPPGSLKTPVLDFLNKQKALTKRYGPEDKDRADADACVLFPDMVPLLKEESSMPESLLLKITACIKRHKSPDLEVEAKVCKKADSDTIELERVDVEATTTEGDHVATNGVMNGDRCHEAEPTDERETNRAEPIADPEGKADSGEMTKEIAESAETSSERRPLGIREFMSVMLKVQPKEMSLLDYDFDASIGDGTTECRDEIMDIMTAKAKSLADHCFSLDRNRVNLRRCLFTVRNPDLADYHSPILGFLPLLPLVDPMPMTLRLKPASDHGEEGGDCASDRVEGGTRASDHEESLEAKRDE